MAFATILADPATKSGKPQPRNIMSFAFAQLAIWRNNVSRYDVARYDVARLGKFTTRGFAGGDGAGRIFTTQDKYRVTNFKNCAANTSTMLVKFTYDAEADVWIAQSNEIPFVTEAPSLEALCKKLPAIIRDTELANSGLRPTECAALYPKTERSIPE